MDRFGGIFVIRLLNRDKYNKPLIAEPEQDMKHFDLFDYRRPLGPVDLVAFVDVINVYGGPGANSLEFDPRRGVNVLDENDAFPIVGLIFERT